MKKSYILGMFFSCVFIFSIFTPAYAALITYKATGVVTTDNVGVIGDTVDDWWYIGTYTIDDSTTLTDVGGEEVYVGAITNYTVEFYYYTFTGSNADLTVGDGSPGSQADLIAGTDWSPTGQAPPAHTLFSVQLFSLTDSDGTAISSNEIPSSATMTNIALFELATFKIQMDSFSSANYVEGTITSIEAVPIPTAGWLFGSGLLGLVAIARRKKGAKK